MPRRNCPLIPVIIGIVVAASYTGETMAQENAEWKDRFFAKAPKHWEDYLRFARSLQVTVIATRYEGADRSPKKNIQHEYKQTEGASLRVFQELGTKGESRAVVINPSYSFQLKSRSSERGWIITNLAVSEQSTDFRDEQRLHQEMQLHTICDCLKLWNLWLPTLIHDSDFKITTIKTQEMDGHPVVQFDFNYAKPDKDYPIKGALPLKGGWMILDPEHDWILRDYLVHTGDPERNFIRKTFQTREGTDHHPIITKASVHIVSKDESPFESFVEGQWRVVEQTEVPLEEFTLSAFGLPEPAGTQVERSRLYLWIALAGIACLGIAVLIRWLSHRAGMAS